MHDTFLKVTLTAVASALGVALAAPAAAQSFPTKPIRLIVPNAPGGGSDTVARVIADKSSAGLGQQMIADNRGGAGGSIAAAMVARSPKDGYTLLLGTGSTLFTGPVLYPERGYKPLVDFTPVTLAGTTAYALSTHPSLPAKTVRDLIRIAKAQPGEINFSSTGPGSPAHLGAELFQAMAQVKMVHIPFKGGSPAMLSLRQGETQVMFSNFLTSLPQARANAIRALAVTTPKRTPLAPEIPTVAESGLPGFELQQFYSVVAPAGTPADIIQTLNREIVRALSAADVKSRLAREGILVVTSTPEELGKITAEQIAKWTKVVKQANINVKR